MYINAQKKDIYRVVYIAKTYYNILEKKIRKKKKVDLPF